MRTNVYVDGFNLYGCLRRTAWKWLDLAARCRNMLQPHHVIGRIRYFTAPTKSTPKNPDQHIRQQAYFRALKTLPGLTVHLGSFQSNTCMRPLAAGGALVKVIDTKEKGSDVNLASYLLLDGFKQEYDAAVVISNDSDLAEPIKLVRRVEAPRRYSESASQACGQPEEGQPKIPPEDRARTPRGESVSARV
jgi:uncharacterized LabA/DUF88 family protein